MVDAGIGRLLISSLHQGIGDEAPTRLDFYENWLSPTGMRDGRLGLAPLGAVLSFLYREGPPTNDRIAHRAGIHAAEWTFAELSRVRRGAIERLPLWLRKRAAIMIGRRLIKSTVRESRMKVRLRRTGGHVEIRSALFDQLRDPATRPMRVFYAAALQRVFQLCRVQAEVRVNAEEGTRWRLDIVLAALLALLLPALAQAQSAAASPILVVPFENGRADSQRLWLREGVAILLTDALAAGGEAVIDREERLNAFERLQIPPLASLSRASVIKVGQAVGAQAVAIGRIEAGDAELTIHARVIRLDSGRLSPESSSKGAPADLFNIVGQLASGLKREGQPSRPLGLSWRPPSTRAFEFYVKGLIADAPAAQIALFEQALKEVPTYMLARLALWQLHTDAGDHQRALAAISANPVRPISREARFMAALSQIHLKRFDEAAQALRTLQGESPAASIANAIGVLELRRSATILPGRATYYFSQATELDEADGDLFFNLGYAYWLERDSKAAIYWLREAVRRDPADGDAHFILGTALQQSGATAEAARERELAGRLSSKYAAWEAKAAGGDPTPRGLERLHDQLANASSRADANILTAGQRDQNELARFHLDAGRRAFDREADREAVVELRRALYLSPYLAEAHTLLARIYLRGGRVDEAIEALKIALWSDETAATHVLLAEAYLQSNDNAAARAEVERALALDPKSLEAQRMKARLAGAPW